MTEPLSVDCSRKVIDSVLQQCNTERYISSCTLSAVRSTSSDDGDNQHMSTLYCIPYYFCFSVTPTRSNNTNYHNDCESSSEGYDNDTTKSNVDAGICTFYLAYSTWDGRMLYVDHLSPPKITNGSTSTKNSSSSSSETLMMIQIYRVLAKISMGLKCARLSWTQGENPNKTWLISPLPEFCEEWLFLKWDRRAMKSFVGYTSTENDNDSTTLAESSLSTFDRSVVKSIIQASLEEGSKFNDNNKVTLRLAGGEDDMNTIGKLVKGLAIYEKEPDAVNGEVESHCVLKYWSVL
jgi:hypothetical protein